MAKMDYEGNRLWLSIVSVVALLGCGFGSWLAFGVLCAATVEYIATMFCEVWAERSK